MLNLSSIILCFQTPSSSLGAPLHAVSFFLANKILLSVLIIVHKFVTSLSLVIGFTGGLSRNSWRHCTKTSLHVRLWTTHRTTRQVMAVPPFCSWAVWNYFLQGVWFFLFYYMSLVSMTRLLPKKILEGPSELSAENLGAQHMKWKVLLWKVKSPRAILREPQATKAPFRQQPCMRYCAQFVIYIGTLNYCIYTSGNN